MPNGQTSLQNRYDTAEAIKNGVPQMPEEGQDVGAIQKSNNFLESIDDYFTGKQSQEREFLYNLATMDEQNKFTKEMWDAENAYNTTSEQLKRWMEAGGNPNAFFNGGTNTGNASSVSSGSGGNIGSTIGLSQGAINTAADTIKKYWENQKTKAEAEGKEIENGTLWEMNTTKIRQMQAEINLDVEKKELTKQEANQIKEMLPLLKNKTSAEIDKMEEEKNLLMAQTDESKKNSKYLDQKTKRELEETNKLKWENYFRNEFGIDPSQSWVQQLITTILSGKGENALDNLFERIKNKGNKIREKTRKKANKNRKNNAKANNLRGFMGGGLKR